MDCLGSTTNTDAYGVIVLLHSFNIFILPHKITTIHLTIMNVRM